MTCSKEIIATFKENSHGGIGVSLTGLDDESVTPNTFLWTLTDTNGNIVNNREDEGETPATETWILLQGLDLAIPGSTTLRLLTISGTFNTVLGGIPRTNVPYTVEYSVDICRQKNTP